MTDEEQKAADIAAAEEATKADAEFESSLTDLTDEEKDQKRAEREQAKNPDNRIDYEKLRQEEEERGKKPDTQAARLAFEERERKRKEKGEEDDEDKPLTRREFNELTAQNQTTLHKTFQETNALTIARANTSSEAEAQAVMAFWRNRVVPSGNLEEDVMFAIGGLNRKVLASKNGELARALKNKDSISRDSATTHKDAPAASEPKISPADAQAYKSAGFAWDGKMRLYKKRMGGEKSTKFLHFDHKTNKKWIA